MLRNNGLYTTFKTLVKYLLEYKNKNMLTVFPFVEILDIVILSVELAEEYC